MGVPQVASAIVAWQQSAVSATTTKKAANPVYLRPSTGHIYSTVVGRRSRTSHQGPFRQSQNRIHLSFRRRQYCFVTSSPSRNRCFEAGPVAASRLSTVAGATAALAVVVPVRLTLVYLGCGWPITLSLTRKDLVSRMGWWRVWAGI